MTDLRRELTAPDAAVTAHPEAGTATVAAGRATRVVPLATLVEPLVRILADGEATSDAVREAGALALEAVQAVAERRIAPSRATGPWRRDPGPGPALVDAFVDAFVAGPRGHEPDASGEVLAELSVDVDQAGAARLRLVHGSSERRAHDALRAAASLWPPVARIAAGEPNLPLSEDEVGHLLGPEPRAALREAGIHIQWGSGASIPTLAASLDEGTGTLSWQLRLPAGELSASEVAALAASHRPLVRIRDAWVVRDDVAAAEVLRRPRRLSAGEQVATVVTGAYGDGARTVPLAPAGSPGERLARITGRPRAVTPPAALRATLRSYQRAGLSWMLRNAELGLGSCLADDMGLGKTVTAIAFHLALRERGEDGPTLVVCPASVLTAWEREIGRFAPTESVARNHFLGRPAGVVLTTYATLRNDRERLAATRWGLVIADEAQMAKNPSSQAARALRALPARHRLALTGTPVQNSLDDLWSLLDWTAPGLLGTRTAFRRRYATPIRNGEETARTQLAGLTALAVLRRRKGDPSIVPELPAKTVGDLRVALTPEQVGLYQALVEESLRSIADGSGVARKGRILALLTALKQVCNHPAHYLGEADPVLSGRSGKLDALTDIVDVTSAEGASALVFTQYVTMGRLIVSHLRRRGTHARLLHGGLTVDARQRLVDAFQDGTVGTLVLSVHAGGTGLTLTRAEHVIHYDQWWNPAVEDQATDRAHRIGQAHPVYVHRLLSEGTLEDRIGELLMGKRALAAAVLDDDPSTHLTELDDRALAELVALSGSPS